MFCECQDIMVRYNGRIVLDVKELGLAKGKITAVVGPNGAGKTTLLEVMAMLRQPNRGQLRLWGKPTKFNDRQVQRRVVMVMHSGYMFGRRVWDNVGYGLKARGIRSNDARRRITEALKMLDLSSFAKRDVDSLSAGERQRVNLARAIAVRPDALLLDEPTANIDAQASALVSDLLLRLRERGSTIVHTNPAPSKLLKISDRIIELKNGQVHEGLSGVNQS